MTVVREGLASVTAARFGVWVVTIFSGKGFPVLEIAVSEVEGGTVCRPIGELDAYTVGEFREQLTALSQANRLVIDLCGVPFMDSTGLGALIGGIRRIRDAGGSVEVVCDRPAVLRLLHTTGFDRIVGVSATVDEALAAFTAAT